MEALEDKVANASMQVKGWRIPNRDMSDILLGQVVGIAKERLASLEAAIERRYLKPPLGARYVFRCYTGIDNVFVCVIHRVKYGVVNSCITVSPRSFIRGKMIT